MSSIFDTPEYKERWAMYQSALDAGLPIVSTETCAIICAMLGIVDTMLVARYLEKERGA